MLEHGCRDHSYSHRSASLAHSHLSDSFESLGFVQAIHQTHSEIISLWTSHLWTPKGVLVHSFLLKRLSKLDDYALDLVMGVAEIANLVHYNLLVGHVIFQMHKKNIFF